MGEEGVKLSRELLQQLQSLRDNSISKLNLNRNKIGAEGAKEISKSLLSNTSLTKLYLKRNNIGDEGAKEISKSLLSNTSLKELYLSKNNIGDKGAKEISKSLLSNTSLTKLYLENNKIGAEGAKEISKSLLSNTSLTLLYLGRNKIGAEGAKEISKSLLSNNSLTKLYLERNNIGDEGAKEISKSLLSNTSLAKLYLWNNKIGDEGAREISKLLSSNTSLTKLSLAGNKFGAEGAKEISKSLLSNTSLTHLYLGWNKIGAKTLNDIERELAANFIVERNSLYGEIIKRVINYNIINNNPIDNNNNKQSPSLNIIEELPNEEAMNLPVNTNKNIKQEIAINNHSKNENEIIPENINANDKKKIEKKELEYKTETRRAALLGETEKLITLIKEDWSLLEEMENEEKNTPLLRAAREGDINTVSSLLLHGANLSAINQSGDDIMKLSLPHNNLYLFLQEKKEIYQRDGDGNTLLHKECFAGNVNQVINLLSKGASVHVYNKDGNSPLHLSLLSQFALEKTIDSNIQAERIKDAKIQAERVKKIGLIVEKLIESGADLNITNRKFQTALSLIVNLGFEKLRIEIGRRMLSNRGEISRGWIRYHLHSALSHYHGDFHHTSRDQHLLDHHVSFLTGYDISELMVEDMWIYIGHLHSLHGEFKTASQDIKKSFENFTISKALSFRIRVLFELLITIEKGLLTEQSLPIPKINLLSLLFDELYFTLESLRVYQDQSLIQEEIYCDDPTPLKDAHILFLQRKIEGLKSEECYSYPTGFLGHAIYLNIERRMYNNEDSLMFRVDNLGEGIKEVREGGRTRHHLSNDHKGNERAFPATFCVSRDSFLKNNYDYLKGITSAKWNFKENSLKFIYDESILLPNRVELDHEISAKIFPSRRIQTVSNCSVKNWQVGLQIRWQSIDQPPSYSCSCSPHFLYRWFRREEPHYLHTKYNKMAQEGMMKYSNNNNNYPSPSPSPLSSHQFPSQSPSHSHSTSLYQSYKKCSEIQKFVESAVSSKLKLTNNIITNDNIVNNNNNKNNNNNNIHNSDNNTIINNIDQISGGWIIDHGEIIINDKVGEGGSGVIYRGKYHETTVAVKQLHGDELSSSDLDEFYGEAKVAFNLRFKHVVQFFGITQTAPYYIVMEFMAKGSLDKLLVDEEKQLTWERKLKLALNMAKGLAFLHLKEIVHRDMKSLNVLVGKNNEVKISDFGLAKVKQSTRSSYKSKSNQKNGDGKLGTVPWKAPELFKLGGKHTTASDVYSLGIVLWEISTCQLPFLEAEDEIQISTHVSTGGRLPLDNEKTPSYYNDIIEKCWAQNVSDRPTASQVVQYLKEALVLFNSK